MKPEHARVAIKLLIMTTLFASVVLGLVCASSEPPLRATGGVPPRPADTYDIAGVSPAEVLPGGVCESCEDRWLVLPDRLVANASPSPPVPLFRDSFVTLARSTIAAKWLPARLDDAKFAAVGEGAMRARTARMLKIYNRDAARVILQGFVGRVVLITKPSPFPLSAEAQALLGDSAGAMEPWGGVQPYARRADGPPPSIAATFQAIRHDVLRPIAQPLNEESWQASLRQIVVQDGWLWVSYPSSALDDPAMKGASGSLMIISTNGTVLRVTVWSTGDPEVEVMNSPLFKALQPVTAVPAALMPGVAKVVTRNEWTNQHREPVPTRGAASHQWFYIRLSDGKAYRAWVPLARMDECLKAAQWVALYLTASSTVGSAESNLLYVARIRRVAESRSRGAALEWLNKQREQCLSVVESLREVPWPTALNKSCEKAVDALRTTGAICDIALSGWRSALSQPDPIAVDYDATGDRIRLSVQDQQRHASALRDEAQRDLRQALTKLGIFVDEDVYTTL